MKKITGFLRLEIEAGKANPSPPVGPALGLRGINIMNFCKEFNARSKSIKDGTIVPTLITIYEDKSISFVIKSPSSSYHVKKNLNLAKGAKTPGKQTLGSIDLKSVYEIAKSKQKDLSHLSVESVARSILGSLQSTGVSLG